MERTYQYYREVFAGRVMPFAFVDLDLFDQNIRDIAVRAGKRTIRIASKSVRSIPLLERILDANPIYRGIMAYSVREAVFLSQQGFDDILVAYPALREADDMAFAEELRRGKRIVLMVDCAEHVQFLEKVGGVFRVFIPVCIDIDMSTQFPGLYFGVRRSPITTPEQALAVCREIKESKYVRLHGLMGYEAQIAGLPDNVPGGGLKNAVVRYLKQRSLMKVRARRARIVEAVKNAGFDLGFVNGGGTGSVESTASESCITEVTVGSGFFSPLLFDWYQGFHHSPAVGYAIEITRKPCPNIYTCHGGGYVASGTGKEKQPRPYLPKGARLLSTEGAGEVQTPVVCDGPESLNLGDPIFMRYSKAGEMCERFNVLLAVSEGKVVDEIPTYRGEGQVFL
ncbi:MAG: amino acid deaminase/aldolase [Candidatus Hydrogenedentes bacterium]|nr:amino acid deaminase/aldolase [Candidatus Hydrogenedentota bacterium]